MLKSSYENKKLLIFVVSGRRMIPSAVDIRKIVSRCWCDLNDGIKSAWSERAAHLTELSNQQKIIALPESLADNHEQLIMRCLQEESDSLLRIMRSFLIHKIMCTSVKKMVFSMPQKIGVDAPLYEEMSMSPLMRRTIFGDDAQKCHHYENVSLNKNCNRDIFTSVPQYGWQLYLNLEIDTLLPTMMSNTGSITN